MVATHTILNLNPQKCNSSGQAHPLNSEKCNTPAGRRIILILKSVTVPKGCYSRGVVVRAVQLTVFQLIINGNKFVTFNRINRLITAVISDPLHSL